MTWTKLLKVSTSSVTPFALLPHFLGYQRMRFKGEPNDSVNAKSSVSTNKGLRYRSCVLSDVSSLKNVSFVPNVEQKKRTSRSESSTALTSSPHNTKKVLKKKRTKNVKPRKTIISNPSKMRAVSERSADRAMHTARDCAVHGTRRTLEPSIPAFRMDRVHRMQEVGSWRVRCSSHSAFQVFYSKNWTHIGFCKCTRLIAPQYVLSFCPTGWGKMRHYMTFRYCSFV